MSAHPVGIGTCLSGVAAVTAALLAASCWSACDSPRCDPAGDVEVALITGLPAEPVSADLTLRGTLAHAGGCAVHSLSVGGVLATAEAAGYETWSVVLTVDLLRMLAAGSDAAAVWVVVVDETGMRDPPIDLGLVPVDAASVPVASGLSLATWTEHGFLPADGSSAAAIWVDADPSASGSEVTLDTTLGELVLQDSTTSATTTVVLAGDGAARATGLALLKATGDAGVATVTATDGTYLAVAAIDVEGTPSVGGPGQQLGPGDQDEFDASPTDRIEWCTVLVGGGAQVEAWAEDGTTSLVGAFVAPTSADDSEEVISVSVLSVPDSGGTLTLACQDPYGQLASREVQLVGAPVE